jgi:hypothetical protein
MQVNKRKLYRPRQNMHTLNQHNTAVKYMHIIQIVPKLFYKLNIITSPPSELSDSSKVETEPIRN